MNDQPGAKPVPGSSEDLRVFLVFSIPIFAITVALLGFVILTVFGT